MSLAPEALLERALSLSPADRAKLSSGLLASLDGDQADGTQDFASAAALGGR